MPKILFEPEDINLAVFEIKAFNSYLEEMEDYMRRESEQIDQSMEENVNSNDENEILERINDYIVFNEFEKIFLSSFIISIYSHFENKLNNICMLCERKFDLNISLEDFNGKGFFRAKNYLEKLCKLTMPSLEILEKIVFLSRVRNYIVHNGGKIKDKSFLNCINNEDEFPRIVNDKFGNDRIVLTPEYAHYASEIMGEYLVSLMKENRKYKK